MKKTHDKKNRNLQEVEHALGSLSNEDLIRLDQAALFLVHKNSITNSEKLLNETIKSVLNGERKWPCDVNFMTFLRQAMRSKADNYHKKQQRMNRLLQADNHENNQSNPEEEFLAHGASCVRLKDQHQNLSVILGS